MGTSPVVEVSGLRKEYGDKVVVDDIDFDVHQGELVALLGPNGAGKSTTIEILEGFRTRKAGAVHVLGTDPAHPTREWRARIGVMPQEKAVTGVVSVRELLDHFATFYARPRAVVDVLGLVGLDDRQHQRITTLSGGQQRRLEVALAVIGRPELLFMDEPTTGFDPEARRQFWDLIRSLVEEGATILLTTHYLDEAEALADRLLVLDAGRIVAEGPPATIGGRSTGAATVRWTDADGPREERTDHPTALVQGLAQRFGGEVPDLVVARPSLEDVYLGLIGGSR